MARPSPAQLISAQPCTHASITAAGKTDAPSMPVCSDNLGRCRATQLGRVHAQSPCQVLWWSSTSASDPVRLYISAFSCNVSSFMSLRANETFCVLFFSAVLVIWDDAAASSSALFSRVYNQNVLWDLQKGDVRSHTLVKGWAFCLLWQFTHYYQLLTLTGTVCPSRPQTRLRTAPTADGGLNLPDTCAIFSCYQEVTLLPSSSGATLNMRPAPLPMEEMEWRQTPPPLTTTPGTFRLRRGSRFTWRKECLAVMERWVRGWGGEGEGKRRGLKIINGSLFRNLSLISTWSWGNTAARPRRRPGVSESLNIGSAVLHT